MKNITFINAGAGSGKTFRLTEELFNAIQNKECKANEVMLTTFSIKAADEIKVKARGKLLKECKFLEANDLQNAYIGTVHAVGQKMIQKFWHYIGFPKEIRVIDEEDTKFYFNQAIAEIPTSHELSRLNALNYKFNPLNKNYRNLDVDKWKNDLLDILEKAIANNINDFDNSIDSSIESAKKIFDSTNQIIDYKSIGEIINRLIEIGNDLPENANKGRKENAKKLGKINKDQIKYIELKEIKAVLDDFQNKGIIGNEYDSISSQLESFHKSYTLINDIKEYNILLFKIAKRSLNKYNDYKKEIGLIDFSDMENGFLKLLDFEEVKNEIRKTIKLILVDEFQDSNPMQLSIFIKLSEIVNRSIWVGDPKQSVYAFRGTDPQLISAVINEFESSFDTSLKTDNLRYSWRSRPEIVEITNSVFKPALKSQVKESNITLEPVRTNQAFKRSALHHFNFIEFKEDKKGKLTADTTASSFNKAMAKGILKILNEQWIVSDKTKSIIHKDKQKEKVFTRLINPNDIAILCKTNDGIIDLVEELNNCGIKVNLENNILKETAEFYLVTAIIKLILSEHNVLAKAELKVLTEADYTIANLIDDRLEFLKNLPEFPSCPIKSDYSEEEYAIELTKFNQAKEVYYKKLNTWGETNLLVKSVKLILDDLQGLPVPQLIEYIINRFNLNQTVSAWGNAEQRKLNLQMIINYAYLYDDRCLKMNLGSSLTGFLHYLDSKSKLAQSKSNNQDAINVLTYHGAKGLEWPMVILCNLEKDVDWGFNARNIFGISVKNKSEIRLEKLLEDRVIINIPWIFGAENLSLPNDLQTHLEKLELYDQAKEKHKNELKRLMYVGFTRARDYLITTALSEKKGFPWMQLLNEDSKWKFEESIKNREHMSRVDLFDRGVEFTIHNLELKDDNTIETKDSKIYFSNKTININRQFEPYVISPSKVKPKENITVKEYKNLNNQIPTGISAEDKDSVLGNCLHDILYLYIGARQSNDMINLSLKIERLINNYDISSVIDHSEVLISITKFYDYINETFNPSNWYRELSLECEIDGQLYKGEADLVLETEEGYILIDYKSYPGSITRVLDESSKNSPKSNYAGKYSGQIDTYVKMIDLLSDKKVILKLIYYTVLGRLIKIE